MPSRDSFGWSLRAALVLGLALTGCPSSPRIWGCDPTRCLHPPPACMQVRGRPSDHVCFNFGDRDPDSACVQFNGIASGFGQPGDGSGLPGEFRVMYAEFECPAPFEPLDAPCDGPCKFWFKGPTGADIHVPEGDIVPCSDPVTTCHLPAACMPMLDGCFGPTTGNGSIRIDGAAECHVTTAGQECTLRGGGDGLICSGPPWTFNRAVFDEDCRGARLTTPPCAGAGAVSLNLDAGGLTVHQENQPDVTYPRGGGSCTPPTPTECDPAALQGCWVNAARQFIHFDAPVRVEPGRWRVGGHGRGLGVCAGGWTFTAAEVDADCMGVRLEPLGSRGGPCLPADDNRAVFRLTTHDAASIQRQSGMNNRSLDRRSDTECPG